MTADGAVPITYRVADGNTVDDGTHIETWGHLVALLGRGDFRYVAHCKLATRDNMDHIHPNRGRFLSVLPASRKEDAAFRDWVVDHDPAWTEAARRPGRRRGDPNEIWHTVDAPWPSAKATASCGSAPGPRSTTTPRRAPTASPAASPPSTSSTNGWPRPRPG